MNCLSSFAECLAHSAYSVAADDWKVCVCGCLCVLMWEERDEGETDK